MKKIFLLALLASVLSGNAQQSLRDALYSGKLKLDTGKVIRKGDDLSSKIDTSTRKPAEPETVKTAVIARDSMGVALPVNPATTPVSTSDVATTDNTAPPKEEATEAKSNTKLWKDFMTEFSATLKTDVLPSKKIKSGTYSVLIEYIIDVDGQVSGNNVSSSPENSYLEQQIKERITLSAPKMTPLLNNFGKPRKAVKKYTLVVTK